MTRAEAVGKVQLAVERSGKRLGVPIERLTHSDVAAGQLVEALEALGLLVLDVPKQEVEVDGPPRDK